MTYTNPINKDDAGYTTLLASLFVMIVAAVFSSTPVTANATTTLVAAPSQIVVATGQAARADTIVVTATRLK